MFSRRVRGQSAHRSAAACLTKASAVDDDASELTSLLLGAKIPPVIARAGWHKAECGARRSVSTEQDDYHRGEERGKQLHAKRFLIERVGVSETQGEAIPTRK
jgi:hypothetical protein